MAAILLTGATSFSGLWIAQALARAGHQVSAPVRRGRDDYAGIRRERLRALSEVAEVIFAHPIESPQFLELSASRAWDVLAHHAADIAGYRSPDYDVSAGLARNTEGAGPVLSALSRGGLRAVVVTGTSFEAGEGGSATDILAASPYGLSKTLTNQYWRHAVRWRGLRFGKFVIAAPFGPWEQGRLTWSLFQSWLSGAAAVVRAPHYVRDNLPACLLAEAYAGLVAQLLDGNTDERIARPAGFVGPQGGFARRVALEAEARLGRSCPVEDRPDLAPDEPLVRVNAGPSLVRGWNDPTFWDGYVAYYQDLQARGLLDAGPG